MRRTAFGVYAPVRSVPFRRGMAYVETNRVLWTPSAPGRRLVDEGVSALDSVPVFRRRAQAWQLDSLAFVNTSRCHLSFYSVSQSGTLRHSDWTR